MKVAGEVVARDLRLAKDLVIWASSDKGWGRRFAGASTMVLKQKGRRHVKESLAVFEPSMIDGQPVVQKAVGWALREATRSDEKLVFAFLKRWKGQANRKYCAKDLRSFLPVSNRQGINKTLIIHPTAGLLN